MRSLRLPGTKGGRFNLQVSSPAVDRLCSIRKSGDKTFQCYTLLDIVTHCCTLRHDSIIPAFFHDFAVVLASLLGFERLDRPLQSCTSWIS